MANESEIESLLRQIHDEEREVRSRAIYALGGLKHERAVAALRDAVRDDPTGYCRRAALYGLMKTYTRLGLAILVALVTLAFVGLGLLLPRALAAQEDTCFVESTGDDATDYGSADALALQMAVDAASAGDVLKIAGSCAGVQTAGGNLQTVYLDRELTLQGGYTSTNWLAAPGGIYDSGEFTATWYLDAGTGPFTATLAFCYTDAEVAGLNEAGLQAFRWDSNAMTWTVPVSTGMGVDFANNCVELTGVSQFSAWTLKDTSQGEAIPTALKVRQVTAQGGGLWLLALVLLGAVLTSVAAKAKPERRAPRYTSPIIIYEGDLEVRAGSPLGVAPDLLDLKDGLY